MTHRPPSIRLSYLLAGLLAALAPVAGCGLAVLTVEDAITQPGKKARLVAYVEREPVLGMRQDVKDVAVTFHVDGTLIGQDDTNDDGKARDKCRVPSSADRFEARAVLDGHDLHATAAIFRWDDDRTAIAVDIDNTISDTEYEDLILEDEDDDSDPLKRARRTLRTLADDYHIIYLTARPRFLLEKTRGWLAEHDFPDGPVLTAPGLRQAVRPEAFKCEALHDLRKRWPNLRIGIGDQSSDAEAYGSNDMLSLIISRRPPRTIGPHAVILRNWKAVARFFEANHETLTDPQELEDVIEGKTMLLQPVSPWEPK